MLHLWSRRASFLLDRAERILAAIRAKPTCPVGAPRDIRMYDERYVQITAVQRGYLGWGKEKKVGVIWFQVSF